MSLYRSIFVVLYVTTSVVALVDARMSAWFWTVLMPCLPAFVVWVGFYKWRRLCPVATLASASARAQHRKLPAWVVRQEPLPAFLILSGALVLRHVWLNGDAFALGVFLLLFAVAAWAVNRVFGGKSWCQYLCPVSFVERLYTDGARDGGTTSRCTPCTACKKSCPDISQERAYRSGLRSKVRRLTGYAFPGIVWGFYWQFALYGGDWFAFFGGAWTRASHSLFFTPGFAGSAEVPYVVAASAALLGCGLLSAQLFLSVEALQVLSGGTRTRARHVTLSLAAFAAFVLFYVFAGAPAIGDRPLLQALRVSVGIVLGGAVLLLRLGFGSRHQSTPVSGPKRRLVVLPGGSTCQK